ncbi:MAG: hypothetical protein EAZ89_13535, partial [Bacteroidetes bacterium]
MAKNGQHRFSGEDEESLKKPVNRDGLRELAGIFRFVLPYRLYFIAGLLFLLLSTGATLTFPYFLGKLVDAAVPGLSEQLQVPGAPSRTFSAQGPEWLNSLSVNQTALVLAAILLIQGIFAFMRVFLFAQVSERAMADIRRSLYSRLIALPMYYFEQRRVGELTSRLSSDVTQLQDVLSFTLAELVRQVLTLVIGVLIMVTVISGKLTLFMISTFPVIIIIALVFGRFIRKLSKQTQDEL